MRIHEINNQYVLAVSYGNYLKADGGVDKVIAEHCQLFNNAGVSYIQIAPLKPGGISGMIFNCIKRNIYTLVIDGSFQKLVDEEEIIRMLMRYERGEKQMIAFHIHHLKKNNIRFLNRISSIAKCNTYFFVHDYNSICEHPNLLENGSRFCGYTAKPCDDCIDCQYVHGIKSIQQKTRKILGSFKNLYIVAPSKIAMNLWLMTFGDLVQENHCFVVPHQKAFGVNTLVPDLNGKIKIAFLGKFGDNKGKNEWIKVANVVKSEKLEYELFYFGTSDIKIDGVTNVYVQVKPDNPKAMYEALVDNGINCAFLWSLCPETYSYTYHEAYSANCLVITDSDSGNIASLVNENNNGKVYSTIEQFISDLRDDTILDIMNKSTSKGPLKYEANTDILNLVGGKGCIEPTYVKQSNVDLQMLIINAIYKALQWHMLR